MPQASEELREKWGIDEQKASKFLESHGFKLTKDCQWQAPPEHTITEEEWSAIEFLIDEWDFGSLVLHELKIEMPPQACEMPNKPTIWRRLGFRHPHVHVFDDVEGMAPGACTTNVVVHMSWGDRLRLLISGRFGVQIRMQTDVTVSEAISKCDIGVLPPFEKGVPAR